MGCHSLPNGWRASQTGVGSAPHRNSCLCRGGNRVVAGDQIFGRGLRQNLTRLSEALPEWLEPLAAPEEGCGFFTHMKEPIAYRIAFEDVLGRPPGR